MNTDNVHRYALYGRKDQFWYQDCEQTFVKLFGREELPLITKLFAATSINTALKSNIRLFRKAYLEIQNNQPVGSYLPNIRNQLIRIRQGAGLSGRKINNFANAMSGNTEAVVVDIWICRAFGLGTNTIKYSPSDSTYERIETWIKREARSLQLQPREFCAMIWSGVRTANGGDKTTHYKEILEAQLTNLFSVI